MRKCRSVDVWPGLVSHLDRSRRRLLQWVRAQNNNAWFPLLSRRSRQRERLSALGLSICLFVRLSVYLSPKCKKTAIFSKTKLFRAMVSIHDLSRTWAFQRTHYWTPIIQDGWDPPSWKSTWRHFFLPCWCRMTCRLWWYGRNRNQM